MRNNINQVSSIIPSLILLLVAQTVIAETYYVSLNGDDNNSGSKLKPFKTIQKAADTINPGDICCIRGGTYHEEVVLKKSGKAGKRLRFIAEEEHSVLLDGTEAITRKWTRHRGNIYKVQVSAPIEQLFVGRKMMVEARWPNMDFESHLFDRKCWATTDEGSRYGIIKDYAVAGTDIDWTGAHITLNVAHQFFTWTRTVTEHSRGKDTLIYPKNLKGITHFANQTKGWENDYYFLSGKLDALDRPTEWFYDSKKKLLYFYAPEGKNPSSLDVRYRVRQYAVTGSNIEQVEFTGIDFFACTFNFVKSNNMLVDRCHIRFPTYSRHVRSPLDRKYSTGISGNHNIIRNCVVSDASHGGIKVVGGFNLIENCLIYNICWHGSLGYSGLNVKGEGNISSHNTIYNGGNALLHCQGNNGRVEYNHVYNGGLLCRDVSLIYTQLPTCRGTVIHHNWVHGCRTDGNSVHDSLGGIGIRGDDQTRGLTVHHNVVWDCGIIGIVVKGDENRVFNNTVFDVGVQEPAKRNKKNSKHLLIPTWAEPKKPWRQQFPLLEVQNANSIYCNNAVGNLVWRNAPLPDSDKIRHNVELKAKKAEAWLVDPKNKNFQPKKNSPLVDTGRDIPGFHSTFQGKAPDIGAYEYGGESWTAGITWNPETVLGDVFQGYE